MFYAAVAPLLPSLTRELHLSKASAGVLTASYAIGTLVGAIPGGVLAERAGPRIALYTGLALMGASSLAFGLVDNIVLLDAARVLQGLGGACTWAGALAWLIAEVPVQRRGSAIGGALAAAIGGALFGPVIGTLAHAFGRATVFSAVVVVAGVLMVSRFYYSSFKGVTLTGRVRFTYAILIPLTFVVIAIEPSIVLLVLFGGFAVSAPSVWLWRRLRRRPMPPTGTAQT